MQIIVFRIVTWRCDCLRKNIILIISLLASSLHQRYLVVFYWSLSDGKCPQVSRTLLSILVDLSNTVVWMVSIRPPISNSSNLLFKPSETVLSAPIIIGITVTLIFHSFLSFLVKLKILSLALVFILLSAETVKFTILQVLSLSLSLSLVDYYSVLSSGQD